MTINLTDPQAPVTDEELDHLIWGLERYGLYPRQLAALKELREVRRAKGEPVMYCSAETIAAARAGEHLLRTLSAPSGDCVIPLFIAPPAPVVPDGWKVVPVELTQDMRAAWDSAPNTDDDDHDMQAAYRAMIEAAPKEVG